MYFSNLNIYFIIRKLNYSDYSENNLSDRSDFESIHPLKLNKKINEIKEENNLYTRKILNNFIESENLFNEETKDFIDNEIEVEKHRFSNHLKKSIDSNQNKSGINNMTLSYSISSNENSVGKFFQKLFFQIKILFIF